MTTLAFLVLLFGCGPRDTSAPDWLADRDSTGFLPLADSPDLCLDCIFLEKLVELGDEDGPGFIDWTQLAVQDGIGQLWIDQRSEIKVFGPTGDFVRYVGRSGQGPMEWSYPLPIYADSDGNVHIIDSGNLRESVFTPDFQLKSERRFPGAEIRDIAPLPGGVRYAASMWMQRGDALGMPLHIIDGGEVHRSFGANAATGLMDHHNSRRRLATDRTGRIFSAKENEYEIEVWTDEGERVGGLSGPLLNALDVKPDFYNRTDNPLPNKILSLQAIDGERLVVISRRPRDDWQEFYDDVRYPDGPVGLKLKDGYSLDSVYDSRIEVIGLPTRTIIARQDRGSC